MRSLLIAVLVCLCVTVCYAEPIGKIVTIAGSATAEGENGVTRALSMNSPIHLNDHVSTAADSTLQIMFNDDSIISQGEKSSLTIDNYVYSPNKKDDVSCSVKMIRGIFRVVTGKITDLRPDRFKVKTRLATIGIRGCDLGFKVTDDIDDVFILHLPEGKSILIQTTPEDEDDLSAWLTQSSTLNIVDDGVTISVTEDMDLIDRPMTAGEATEFFELLAGTVGTQDDSDADKNNQDDTGDNDLIVASSSGEKATETVAAEASQSKRTETTIKAKDNAEDEIRLKQAHPDLPKASVPLPVDETPTTDPKNEPGPTTAPPTDPDPDITPPPPTQTAFGTGKHWAWEIFSDASMYYDTLAGPVVSGAFFSDNDYQTLAATARVSPYTLTGSGSAAAAIDDNGTLTFLRTGSSTLTVNMNSTPTWSGVFSASDGTDSLTFNASGAVGTDGTTGGLLTGNQTFYKLDHGGAVYTDADITAELIEGKLVGAGPNPATISGAAGQFAFAHGSLLRVDGAFGADLN